MTLTNLTCYSVIKTSSKYGIALLGYRLKLFVHLAFPYQKGFRVELAKSLTIQGSFDTFFFLRLYCDVMWYIACCKYCVIVLFVVELDDCLCYLGLVWFPSNFEAKVWNFARPVEKGYWVDSGPDLCITKYQPLLSLCQHWECNKLWVFLLQNLL